MVCLPSPVSALQPDTDCLTASMKNTDGSLFMQDQPTTTSLAEESISPFGGAQSFNDWTNAYESSVPAIDLPQPFDQTLEAPMNWARHNSTASQYTPTSGSVRPGHVFGQQHHGSAANQWNASYSRSNSESNLMRLTSLQPKVIPSNDASSSRAPSLTSSNSTRSSDLSTPPSPADVKMENMHTLKRKSEDFTAQGTTSLIPEPPPKRKRGRPKLNRSDSSPGSMNIDDKRSGSSTRTPARLPHNQVERRYREGLNAELEKLRSAVPTLHYGETDPTNATPKASKATVLSAAVDYIKSLEAQRECLFAENERLRTEGRGRAGWVLGGMG